MAITTTKKISLDFYNRSIVTVEAKQLDTDSRYIEVTCTDNGQKVSLGSSSMSAFVRCKKPDNTEVFNDAEITDDGTALITLTQQMLLVEGQAVVDLIIVNTSNVSASKLTSASSVYDLGASVLSTMSFYLNISPTAITHDNIVSSDEYDAFVDAAALLASAGTTYALRTYYGNNYISVSRASDTTVGTNSIAYGYNCEASGNYTQAVGYSNVASTIYAHAEGHSTSSSGSGSHSEGSYSVSSGTSTHAEGHSTTASGIYSHAEGYSTAASGSYASHAEGYSTTASGSYGAHSEGRGTTASGSYSHAEGYNTKSSATASHAEGYGSEANASYSHAEGSGTVTTNGVYAHAEGNGTEASYEASHAEGSGTEASSEASHAEGISTTASGSDAHAEGMYSTASGTHTHAEGYNTVASSSCSHAEGNGTKASADNAHAEGSASIASAASSHAEGYGTTANGAYSHAEGNTTTTSAASSHAEGYGTTASGNYSHAEGYNTVANYAYSHAEGYNTTASGSDAHAEGYSTTASGGHGAHAEGNGATASGSYSSHAEGSSTAASGEYGSHAEGRNSTASGATSHAQNYYTKAVSDYSSAAGYFTETYTVNEFVIGQRNTVSTTAGSATTTTGNAFVIGNGTGSSALSNAFRVTKTGAAYGLYSFSSSGADYAEFIKEWADGNTEEEDRVGYFVTIKDGLLYKADADDYIIGITSGNPSVVGNGDENYYWRYERDEFNRFIYEDVEEEIEQTDDEGNIVIDEETGEPVMVKTGEIIKNGRLKRNTDYDPTQIYIERKDRPEWDYVGMMGVLPVRDDGTCEAGGFCKCADGGIATASDTKTDSYFVIERINDNVISVVVK